MNTKKALMIIMMMLILVGCQNVNSKEFNESDFYSDVREKISDSISSTQGSSISTNTEFSERLQQKIKVLNIQLIDESEEIYKLDYQMIIIDLKNRIDLEALRLNYDLIHISFIFLNDKEKTVYEYLNMTNAFAESDSALTNLVIE